MRLRIAIVLTAALLPASGCVFFTSAYPCEADVNCPDDMRCQVGTCVKASAPDLRVDGGGLADRDAGEPGPDASAFEDAGSRDAGEVPAPDAGDVDAGEGVHDAGTPGDVDAGPRDAGDVDAGDLDAGLPDGGAPDGGAPCTAPTLTAPGTVFVSSAADIEALRAQYAGECVHFANDLRVANSFGLESLDGLDFIYSIGGDLQVRGNFALASIAGLSSLTSVGQDFEVLNNFALPHCDVVAFAAGLTVGDETTINGNMPPYDCP